MKKHFAPKHFASRHFACGHFAGVGQYLVLTMAGLELTLVENRGHWRLEVNRCHYTMMESETEHQIPTIL